MCSCLRLSSVCRLVRPVLVLSFIYWIYLHHFFSAHVVFGVRAIVRLVRHDSRSVERGEWIFHAILHCVSRIVSSYVGWFAFQHLFNAFLRNFYAFDHFILHLLSLVNLWPGDLFRAQCACCRCHCRGAPQDHGKRGGLLGRSSVNKKYAYTAK